MQSFSISMGFMEGFFYFQICVKWDIERFPTVSSHKHIFQKFIVRETLVLWLWGAPRLIFDLISINQSRIQIIKLILEIPFNPCFLTLNINQISSGLSVSDRNMNKIALHLPNSISEHSFLQINYES
jgi:hypothetical protein